ncbi:uncharacterized protein LOC134247521, partial [Saccostrea cucullata]|uniref:uncharacterized protein LOC134247521 n=1 Tax=Saccostrea cuccullata TaxID=36930 RepID=UPI002ED1C7DD
MGSQKIKAAFYSTIEEITGKEELEIYNAEYHSDFLSIQEDLEQKIAEFTPNDHNEYLKLNITPSFCELVKERLQNMPNFKDRLHIRRDKCYLGLEEVKSYMNAPVSDICNYTQKALSHPKGKKVKTILLVGGFSQLKMLREKMSSKFPNMTIYVPPDARLAALRGALIYGFNRKILRERNASFTYVFTYVFTEKNGEECKMLDKKVPFQQIISIGSLIEEDTQIYEQTLWNVPGSKYVTFFFYASTEENPEDLKSENSFFIGSSSLALDPLGSRKIKISVSFTGTLMGVTLCCLPEKNESTIYLKSGYKLDTDEYEHVAAIDFGTTYSGFAYLSKHDFKSGQGIHKIETKIWIGGSLVSSKTSTCILFNPDGKFDSFGFEAEDKYSELVLEGSHAD